MLLLLCVLVRRGVLNIVHGTHDTVNRILDHPDIAAVSFVGGDKAGRYIYERAAANGKRVQVSVSAVQEAFLGYTTGTTLRAARHAGHKGGAMTFPYTRHSTVL